MRHILRDYQERNFSKSKKRISVFKVFRVALYASIVIFIVYMVFKGFHPNKNELGLDKKPEPEKKVLNFKSRSSYV